MKKLNVGDKIKVQFNKNVSTVLFIQAKTEDEVLAVGLHEIFGTIERYPTSTIILGAYRSYRGVNLNSGDKVVVVTKDGKPLEMYISHFLDKDSFVLSMKKNGTPNTLKWLLDMMKH